MPPMSTPSRRCMPWSVAAVLAIALASLRVWHLECHRWTPSRCRNPTSPPPIPKLKWASLVLVGVYRRLPHLLPLCILLQVDALLRDAANSTTVNSAVARLEQALNEGGLDRVWGHHAYWFPTSCQCFCWQAPWWADGLPTLRPSLRVPTPIGKCFGMQT